MTNDYGANWTLLTDGTNGIPADTPMHVVREDPEQEGLLYAGTETGVYVSFDQGTHWQTLQQNLPATPVTDIKVHHGDLVVATMGRSFWILDDVAPLRQAPLARPTAAAMLLPAPRRVSRRPGKPEAGKPSRREPALRRGLLLLARRRAFGGSPARDLGRRGEPGADVLERGEREARSGRGLRDDEPARGRQAAREEGGPEPVRLGPAVSGRGHRARRDRLGLHGRSRGAARRVSRDAPGGRLLGDEALPDPRRPAPDAHVRGLRASVRPHARHAPRARRRHTRPSGTARSVRARRRATWRGA